MRLSDLNPDIWVHPQGTSVSVARYPVPDSVQQPAKISVPCCQGKVWELFSTNVDSLLVVYHVFWCDAGLYLVITHGKFRRVEIGHGPAIHLCNLVKHSNKLGLGHVLQT